MKAIVFTGRVLFSIIFLLTPINHFTQKAIDYGTANGVPFASFLVPASSVLACLGAISIITGYKTKAGAWFIVLFLVPVTLTMHRFWNETDAMMAQMQMANFMKNVSMTGAALIISYFGAGPLSYDAI